MNARKSPLIKWKFFTNCVYHFFFFLHFAYFSTNLYCEIVSHALFSSIHLFLDSSKFAHPHENVYNFLLFSVSIFENKHTRFTLVEKHIVSLASTNLYFGQEQQIQTLNCSNAFSVIHFFKFNYFFSLSRSFILMMNTILIF